MKILISVMFSSAARFLRKGNFPVNPRDFRMDPDKEAVRVASKWIKEIKMNPNMNCRYSRLSTMISI
ncbi:hypothetical protein ACFVHQ_21670 [Actinomycetes bacterium NPDC127524]